MDEVNRNPKADKQQSMARKAAKKVAKDIRAYLGEHPLGSNDHVICPSSGHGAWILQFLNKELARHGLVAEFYYDESDNERKYKVMKTSASGGDEWIWIALSGFAALILLYMLFGS